MCQVGHNIPGGWAFTPCSCKEAEADRKEYQRKLPERIKHYEGLGRRGDAWERKLNIS